MNASRYPLTIYYDASCALCATEMHTLRDYDRTCRLRLVDCSAAAFDDSAMAAAGFPRSALLQRIHARDAAGEWYSGVDVFVLAYRAAGIEAIARLWEHPRLRPLWNRLYPWIARHRRGLTRLRLDGVLAWFVRRAARRAHLRTSACDAPGCGQHKGA
jgi:predicted DCC family thiol-disulfide oxidoreductase YuxK